MSPSPGDRDEAETRLLAPFGAELEQLQRRIQTTRQRDLTAGEPRLLQDLETAYEELRVAEEEVRTQEEQIAGLLQSRQLLRWQYERMMAVLPTPALITDSYGTLQAVNAAAAAMWRLPVRRMLGRPVFGLVAAEERSALRRRVSLAGQSEEVVRQPVRATPREADPVPVECCFGRLPGSPSDLAWTIFPVGPSTAEPSPTRPSRELAGALARLATLPAGSPDRQELLREAGHACVAGLGPGLAVSLALGPALEPLATSATSRLAQAADGAQLAAGQGPSVSAYAAGGTILAEQVHGDERWPRLVPALDPAVHSVLALPLEGAESVAGVMTVYSETLLVPDVVEAAELLATTVAGVLQELDSREELAALARDMEAALASRATIEQAKGVVMAERRVGPDEAFQHLVTLSSTTHRKLREVARAIVEARDSR